MRKANLIKVVEKEDMNQSVLPDDEDCEDSIYDRRETYKKVQTKVSKNQSLYTGNESVISLEANNISSLFMKKYGKYTENGPNKSYIMTNGNPYFVT